MADPIRRQFVSIEEGQVHYRECGDPSRPVLVMFHASPGSSWNLSPLIEALGQHRRVIALDTLGNGDSAPPRPAEPDIAYYAGAHVRALDALGIGSFDLYGTHTGAAICMEVSIAQPARVRRIVMDGVSLFDPKMRDSMMDNNHAPALQADHFGTQMLRAFTMVRDAHLFWPWWNHTPERRRDRGLPDADYLHCEAVEVLKAWRTYHKSYRTALTYPKHERLPLVTSHTLVASSPTDPLRRFIEAVVALMPNARGLVTEGEDTPAALAATARTMVDFLDRG